jgi:hypothetical protein
VRNVYNGVQIKIICLQNELGVEQKLVPEFEDIFDEDETKEDDEEDEEEGNNEDDLESDDESSSYKKKNKRKRYDPEYLEKMHKKREWEEKR